MSTYPKTYFKNLDAMRFFAFLMIFLDHVIFSQNFSNDKSALHNFFNRHFIIGIDFYTILSGFLITWIILEEYKFTRKFNLPAFWLKRTLRIWPVYFLLIFIGFFLVWIARNILEKNVSDMPPLAYLFSFTLNFYIIKCGQGFLFFIVFLWTISVEEQFYIIFGTMLKWLKKAFIPFCVLLILTSLIFRFLALHQPLNLFFNSLSWVGTFAAGGLLAYFSITKRRLFERIKNIPLWLTSFIYIIFIFNLIFYTQIYASDFMVVIERLSISFFLVFLLFEQNFCEKHVFEFGKIPFLNYLGKISYGLFCYHGLVILLYEQATQHINGINSVLAVFLINPVAIFAVTVTISALSYRYFEKPIMSLRHKYQPA
jgi:peptidoglycan/LPS O-acetylase OafA/YrhL